MVSKCRFPHTSQRHMVRDWNSIRVCNCDGNCNNDDASETVAAGSAMTPTSKGRGRGRKRGTVQLTEREREREREREGVAPTNQGMDASFELLDIRCDLAVKCCSPQSVCGNNRLTRAATTTTTTALTDFPISRCDTMHLFAQHDKACESKTRRANFSPSDSRTDQPHSIPFHFTN